MAVLTVMTPEVRAPGRAASPAPVSSASLHSGCPRGQAAVLSPRGTLVCCPQLSPQYSDGILSTVLVNLKCQLVPRHIHELVRAEATEGATSANPKTWKSPLLSPGGGCQRPHPHPHSSGHQDTTDWIDAEDFPFLWFFCLF